MSNDLVKIDPTGLTNYDAMQRAIVVASSVDEVKDIQDRAVALQKYAHLARNVDAERRCAQIRIMAMTRGGELAAKQIEANAKAREPSVPKGSKRDGSGRNGGGTVLTKGNGKAAFNGDHIEVIPVKIPLTPRQSSQWQQLAQNPKAVKKYLDNVKTPDVPTVEGAIAAVNPDKKKTNTPIERDYTPEALSLWGHLRDLAGMIFPVASDFGRLKQETGEFLDYVIPRLEKLRRKLP